jgi:hypothetical protein
MSVGEDVWSTGRDEVAGGWRTFYNEKPHSSCSLSCIGMGWVGHVAQIKRQAAPTTQKGRDCLEYWTRVVCEMLLVA